MCLVEAAASDKTQEIMYIGGFLGGGVLVSGVIRVKRKKFRILFLEVKVL